MQERAEFAGEVCGDGGPEVGGGAEEVGVGGGGEGGEEGVGGEELRDC